MSTGNTTDFGDLSAAKQSTAATGNDIRGVFGGGRSPTLQDAIDVITIATTGNAADFGNLTDARTTSGATGDNTRALFKGGADPGYSDIIDYITIASLVPQQLLVQQEEYKLVLHFLEELQLR